MPIIGGHRPHKKSDQEKKNTKKGEKYTHYSHTNDVALQLKNVKSFKNYCKLPDDYYATKSSGKFINKFFHKVTKWLKKQDVEVD